MQAVPVEVRLVARQDAYRIPAAPGLRSRIRQSRCQRRQIASRDRIAAQLLRARQHHTELPLRFAQFKNQVHRGILGRGGCVSVSELEHLVPPRLDGWWKTNPNFLATR